MPLGNGATASDFVRDFVHSKNKMFAGDDKAQRIKRGLGAYYAHRADGGTTKVSEKPSTERRESDAATLIPVLPTINAIERMHQNRNKAQGISAFAAGGDLGLAGMGKRSYFNARAMQNATSHPALPHLTPPRGGGVHLISSGTPGRTDRIRTNARAGSFVMPADVVSGLGQGNTQAGAKMWGQAISHATGPYGAGTMGRSSRAMRPPPAMKPMRMTSPKTRFDEGGEIEGDDYQAIITAGGELLIEPETVAALGGGSPEAGKKMLNDSVLHVRKQIIEQMRKLPGPVQ